MPRYSFPEQGVTIEAKDRQEAERILQGEKKDKKKSKSLPTS